MKKRLESSAHLVLSAAMCAIALLGSSKATAEVEAAWQTCHGPTGAFVTTMAALGDGTLFAGTWRGLYRLPPGTTTWLSTGLDYGDFFVRALLGASDGTLFAEIEIFSGDLIDVRVLMSSDGGDTWQDTGRAFYGDPLHFAETPDGVVWAGGDIGLLRWDPEQQSWTEISIDEIDDPVQYVASLAADSSGTLFAGVFAFKNHDRGLWRSSDGGETWQKTLDPGRAPAIIATGAGQTVLAGFVDGLVYLSTDSGLTWAEVGCPEDGSNCLGLHRLETLAVLPDGAIIAGGSTVDGDPTGGLWRCEGPGQPWHALDAWTDPVTTALWLDADEGWVAYPGHLYRTGDGGGSFERRCDGMVRTEVASLVRTSSAILALTRVAGLHRSFDFGQTWELLNLPTMRIPDLAVGDDDTIYAATDLGVFQSLDQGESWLVLPGTANQGFFALATTPDGGLCALGSDSVRCTADRGDTWSVGTPTGSSFRELVALPSGVLFLRCVSPRPQTIQRSTDFGRTWEVVYTAEWMSALTVSADGLVLAAVNEEIGMWWAFDSRLVWSDDLGETWSLSDARVDEIASLEAHRWWGLLAGTVAGTELWSRDRGASWSRFGSDARCSGGTCPPGALRGHVSEFLFVDDQLFVGTSGYGAYRSEPQVIPRRTSSRLP